MTAAEIKACSDIGVDVMKDGGNAVDAAIATSLCVGTFNSFSTGIGGGGFMLIRTPSGKAEVIDFRETAPGAATQDMYSKFPQNATRGGLAIGVPGELRGYEMAHKRHGRLPWKRLFEPSIKLAREGITVTDYMEHAFNYTSSLLLNDPVWRSVFAPNNKLLKAGDVFTRPAFARTLEIVANKGADAFYRGELAESIVSTIRQNGGIITLGDFYNYTAVVREPVVGWYHGRKIITAGPPASGALLTAILNILEGYDLKAERKTDLNVHRLVEAFKFAYAFRSELGDPSYWPNSTDVVKMWNDKAHAEEVRVGISDFHTFPPEHYGGKFSAEETPGTMHVSLVDKEGYAVGLTATINLLFGAQIMDITSGVILNNEMDDFSSPTFNNSFRLPPSPSNFIVPGKRPMSSSAPVIVEHNMEVLACLGGSGGSRITTGVAQVLLNLLDYQMDPLSAVMDPRVHHQLFPDSVQVEWNFSPDSEEALRTKGHLVEPLDQLTFMSIVNTILRSENGMIYAVSDPRKRGLAAAY
ncbi:gamma-glutamyltranspeptidase [Gonapodya prolifera JEL478]|uniref:Gamma-glutamyltranspeptidase n=1 Tax=Gonapodya prolifera (strain JEL478) TaxID=1344416 RepID=A0A139AE70_GONPJ|nr:gamma-glutamyltranspeptidase [Gonapodya prolifera JEL478]|eukprot:KXS15091.1 gamma-glutamyltranspeptidase [Gonapodya prolifera JEL478]